MVQIGVIGSINTDFVVGADRNPEGGETIYGHSFTTNFGGKGANQAIAIARLGADTTMVGAVGDDTFGEDLITNLKGNDIDTGLIKEVADQPSGTAVVTIVEGENSIIYIPGVNDAVTPSDIDQAESTLSAVDFILVQNETPRETVNHLIDFADNQAIPILLNPAPARELENDMLEKLTFLTPNESEFKVIFGNHSFEDVLAEYPNKVIVTVGSKGAIFHDGDQLIEVPAFEVNNIQDTTGAGDTFNGAFVVAKASGMSILESIKFSNLASSLAIQVDGAQTGIPTLKEIKKNSEYHSEWNTFL